MNPDLFDELTEIRILVDQLMAKISRLIFSLGEQESDGHPLCVAHASLGYIEENLAAYSFRVQTEAEAAFRAHNKAEAAPKCDHEWAIEQEALYQSPDGLEFKRASGGLKTVKCNKCGLPLIGS